MGAAVGGGFNAYYTARSATQPTTSIENDSWRRSTGRASSDLTAEPAEGPGFEPRYSEADEEILSDVG